jgi:hypothetical protein
VTDDVLQRYLDDFGDRLERAATGRRRRRRLVPAFGIAIAGATAIIVLLAAPFSDRHLDVVAQARAALGRPGELVHFVVRQQVTIASSGDQPRSTSVTTSEQWSTVAPPRWRVALTYPDPSKTPHAGGIRDAHGLIIGPVQVAYARGSESTYLQRRNTLKVLHGLKDTDSTAQAPGVTALGNDPVATIRSLLARHQLRDGGSASIMGRPVRRLIGTQEQRVNSRSLTTKVEYDVDPKTFAPVAARVTPPSPSAAVAPVITLTFLHYSQVPLTSENRHLLEISTDGTPKITRTP